MNGKEVQTVAYFKPSTVIMLEIHFYNRSKGHIINYGRGGGWTKASGKFYPQNFAIPPIE